MSAEARDSLEAILESLNNLKGYRVQGQESFLAHVRSLEKQVIALDREAPPSWVSTDPIPVKDIERAQRYVRERGWVGEAPPECACGHREAEGDRTAVLRCPVHGQGVGEAPPSGDTRERINESSGPPSNSKSVPSNSKDLEPPGLDGASLTAEQARWLLAVAEPPPDGYPRQAAFVSEVRGVLESIAASGEPAS